MASYAKEQPLSMAARGKRLFVQFTPEVERWASLPGPAGEEMPESTQPGKPKVDFGRIFELLSLYK